jgi:hypothetical protein
MLTKIIIGISSIALGLLVLGFGDKHLSMGEGRIIKFISYENQPFGRFTVRLIRWVIGLLLLLYGASAIYETVLY